MGQLGHREIGWLGQHGELRQTGPLLSGEALFGGKEEGLGRQGRSHMEACVCAREYRVVEGGVGGGGEGGGGGRVEPARVVWRQMATAGGALFRNVVGQCAGVRVGGAGGGRARGAPLRRAALGRLYAISLPPCPEFRLQISFW